MAPRRSDVNIPRGSMVSPPSTATQVDTTVVALKSPTAARLIGIIPGAGHMYAGEVEHGLLYAAAIPSLVLVGALVGGLDCLTESWMSGEPCGLSPVLTASLIAAGGLWAWSIFDAGRAAQRTNAKHGAKTSLILQATRLPTARHGDRTAVRFGLRMSTR